MSGHVVKRTLAVIACVVGVALLALLIYMDIWVKTQELDARKSIVIGKTYQAEGSPYPVQVTVLGFDKSYDIVLDGDLTINLPEGSIEPRITRFWFSNSSMPCAFAVDFTAPDGTRQTETWNQCVSVKELTVIPHEIRVK